MLFGGFVDYQIQLANALSKTQAAGNVSRNYKTFRFGGNK